MHSGHFLVFMMLVTLAAMVMVMVMVVVVMVMVAVVMVTTACVIMVFMMAMVAAACMIVVFVMVMVAAACMIVVFMMVMVAATSVVVMAMAVTVMLMAVAMMVVMMTAAGVGLSGVAVDLRACLPFLLQLHRDMVHTVLLQFLTDGSLQGHRITIAGNHMKGSIVIVAIQAPNVQMMYALYMVDMAQMGFQLLRVDALGCFLHKDMEYIAHTLHRMDEDEKCHTDGHNGVNEGEIGKADDDSAHKHDHPTQHIFQHMQVHGLFVERFTTVGKPCCCQVHSCAQHRHEDHAIGIDLHRIQNAIHRIAYHHQRTHQENHIGNGCTQHRETAVAIGIGCVRLTVTFALQEPGSADADGITKIMERIGNDGHAAGEDTAYQLKNRKT